MPGSLRGLREVIYSCGGLPVMESGKVKAAARQRLLDEKDTDLRKFLIAITVRARYHDDRKSVEFWRNVYELTVPEKTDGYSLGGK